LPQRSERTNIRDYYEQEDNDYAKQTPTLDEKENGREKTTRKTRRKKN